MAGSKGNNKNKSSETINTHMNKFMKYELVYIEEHSRLLSAMDLIGYLALSCGHLASIDFCHTNMKGKQTISDYELNKL